MKADKAIGGLRKPMKRHAGMFGSPERGFTGRADPKAAAAARWSKDRREFAAIARDVRPESAQTLYDLMMDPKVEPAVRKGCAELFLAYSDGKPRQSVDIAIGGPRSTATIPTAELEAMLVSGRVPYALEHKGTIIEGETVERVNVVNAEPVPAAGRAKSVPRSVQRAKAHE
jgi:hypothetical protein